jgi:hypothetical protein
MFSIRKYYFVNVTKMHLIYVINYNKYVLNQFYMLKTKFEKSKLTNAIKIIGNKNIKQISEYQKTYSEFNNSKSKQNDKYLKNLLIIIV